MATTEATVLTTLPVAVVVAPTEVLEEAALLTMEETLETFSAKACSKKRAPIRRARVQTLSTLRDPTTIVATANVLTVVVIGHTVEPAIVPTVEMMTALTVETHAATTEEQPAEATRTIVDASSLDLATNGRRPLLKKVIAPSRRK